MRVPPPGTLKLDRRALLRDVRERLAERLPAYAEATTDPTDPGWLLLEQAAWTAEILSGQLDQYPYAVVQHFVRMMGGQLLPARPALGVVVVEADSAGTMAQNQERPSPWRFFTTQTETADVIEFVPVEPAVPILKGLVDSLCQIEGGALELVHHRAGTDGIEAHAGWRGAPLRCGIFDREEIQFVFVSSNTDQLVATLEGALEKLADRRLGWADLSVAAGQKGQVTLAAVIDPAHAFAETAPGELWAGGDLTGHWNTLDDINWTPPVEIADHPLLPMHLRGSRPMPGLDEGTILVPDVPANFPLDQLLVRDAAPMPAVAVEALWRTLTHIDKKLAPFKPTIRRSYPAAGGKNPEPGWVLKALESGVWNQLAEQAPIGVAHLRLQSKPAKNGTARLGVVLVHGDPDELPEITAYGQHADGNIPAEELEVEVAWRLSVPPLDGGHGMWLAVALDVAVEPDLTGVLLAVDGGLQGALFNPLLVVNAPAVRDGREIRVQRNIPEAASLLFGDLVTPEVLGRMDEEPIPDDALELVQQLPLSWFTLKKGSEVQDWRGVEVDPTEGRMTLNAPDQDGHQTSLPAGERVKLTWYRRTDGGRGDVPAAAIQLLEQEANVKPSLATVSNPVGTFFGADRETPEAAVDRLFAPAGGTPVLPSDFERVVRQALGTRGQGWMVRCWSYSERSLVSASRWPLEEGDPEADFESMKLDMDLEDAGPDCLLVALGPMDGALSDEDLDWARRTVQQKIRRFGERLPVVRRAVVTRFWPLTLKTAGAAPAIQLPCFDLRSLDGTLVDPDGRESAPPRSAVFLNAAVVEVEAGEAEEDA
jgi:hypothetical protein